MKSRQVVLKNLFVGKKWMRMWRMDFWTQCGEGESGTNGESSINVYTLSGVRWIAGEKSLCDMGNPVWHSVMNWSNGMAGGEGGSGGTGCVYNYR